MKRLALVLAGAALLAAPAAAQVTGSSNRNAPRIEQTMDLRSTGKITVNYTGISFGQGRWADSLESEESKASMRSYINDNAARNPVGTFATTQDVMIGDVKVPKGEYDLSFRLNDDYAWELTLDGGERKIAIPIQLMETEQKSQRLVVSVYAGDEDFTGGLYVAFGNEFGTLDIKPARSGDDG